MPAEDSPAVLVARFLRSNNYHETLDAFLSEAGLPPDTGSTASQNALTIEQILQEKKIFDVNAAFEKVNVADDENAWSVPAPSIPTTVDALSGASNILHVAVEKVVLSEAGAEDEDESVLIATSADRTVNMVSPVAPFALKDSKFPASESPVLSSVMLSRRHLVTSSMSGLVALHDLATGAVLDTRRDHLKYVVKAASTANETGRWLAAAAWDARVLVYRLGSSTEPPPTKLGPPAAEVKLPTNPEAILFISHPEFSTPVLLLTRRDSTFLYYYAIPDTRGDGDHTTDHHHHGYAPLTQLGRQNLAPHSNAWVAFTPSALALSPADPSLLAVATSAVPHMKLIVVRLLLPPPPRDSNNNTTAAANTNPDAQGGSSAEPLTQASQARAALALQDREAAAMLIHVTTLAPQTPYSTPALAWRPDASGIYVNGDDGVVRGIEVSSGKVIAVLKDGHEAGCKVRCLWAGWVDGDGTKDEVIVSGGFDRRLVVWRVEGRHS